MYKFGFGFEAVVIKLCFHSDFPSPGKGKSLQQRKAKPPKKQEEKEKRAKGKSQEDELKDTLADDDSSSTTTETSNPDTEPLLREVQLMSHVPCHSC